MCDVDFRMSVEVKKSQEKMSKLHAELGTTIFQEWRREQGSEVLSPEQQMALERAATTQYDWSGPLPTQYDWSGP